MWLHGASAIVVMAVALFAGAAGQATYPSTFPGAGAKPATPQGNMGSSVGATPGANAIPNSNPQQEYQLPSQEPYPRTPESQYPQTAEKQGQLIPEGQYLEALRQQRLRQQQQQQQRQPQPSTQQQYPEQAQQQQPKPNLLQILASTPVDSANQTSVPTASATAAARTANATTLVKLADIEKHNGTSNNSTISNSSNNTIHAVSPTPPPAKTGMDQKDGQADSLVDYALGLAGYKDNTEEKPKDAEINGAQKDGAVGSAKLTPTTAKVTPSPSQVPFNPTASGSGPSSCNVPATLEVCGMPESLQQEYFKFGVTVKGVLSSIFKPETATLLAEKCDSGTWCLSYNEHLKIRDGMERLYLDGPLCSDAMRECLSTVTTQRKGCDDKDLIFLTSTAKTLCDLSQFGLTDKGCYTSATEALYTFYVHMFPPVDTKPPTSAKDFCHTFTANMAKTYLCADDACSYDQEEVLEEFQPWAELALNATSVFSYCNMSDICPYEVEEEMDKIVEDVKKLTTDQYDAYDYAEDYYDYDDEEGKPQGASAKAKEGEKKGEEGGSVVEAPASGQAATKEEEIKPTDTDTEKIDRTKENNIFLGLVVMTALAGVVVLGLSFLSYKRLQASRVAGYKRGYSQLTEEESRMLRNEYN